MDLDRPENQRGSGTLLGPNHDGLSDTQPAKRKEYITADKEQSRHKKQTSQTAVRSKKHSFLGRSAKMLKGSRNLSQG
jgi:hypothetical protein